MEKQETKFFRQGYYIDYLRYSHECLAYEICKIQGQKLSLRDANNFRSNNIEKAQINCPKVSPFRTKSIPKQEFPALNNRIYQLKSQVVSQNLAKLKKYVELLNNQHNQQALFEKLDAVQFIQFFCGRNYYQIIKLFATCIRDQSDKDLIFQYLKMFLDFLPLYWKLLDFTDIKFNDLYCSNRNAFMCAHTFIFSNMLHITLSRHVVTFTTQNSTLVKYQDFSTLINGWFQNIFPIIKQKGCDKLNESAYEKILKLFTQLKTLKNLTFSEQNINYILEIWQNIMMRLPYCTRRQFQNFNNYLIELNASLRKYIPQKTIQKLKAELRIGSFVIRAKLTKQCSQILQQIKLMNNYLQKQPEYTKFMLEYPQFQEAIYNICVIMTHNEQLSLSFQQFFYRLKMYIPKIVVKGIIYFKKIEIFKKLEWNTQQFILAANQVQNNRNPGRQQLILSVEIIKRASKFSNNNYHIRLQEITQVKQQLLHKIQTSKEQMLSQNQKRNQEVQIQQLQQLEKRQIKIKETIQMNKQTEKAMDKLTVFIIKLCEQLVDSDVNSLIIDNIQTQILKKKSKFMDEYTKSTVNEPNSNFFRESYVFKSYLKTIILQIKEKFNQLSQQQLNNLICILIQSFKSLSNNLQYLNNKNLLQCRKQNINMLLEAASYYFPNCLQDMFIIYLRDVKYVDNRQFKFRHLETIYRLINQDKFTTKTCSEQKKFDILAHLCHELKIQNQHTYKFYQLLFIKLNMFRGNLEEYKDLNNFKFSQKSDQIYGFQKFYEDFSNIQKNGVKRIVLQFLYRILLGLQNQKTKKNASIYHTNFLIHQLKQSNSRQSSFQQSQAEYSQQLLKLLEIQNAGIRQKIQAYPNNDRIKELQETLGQLTVQIKYIDPHLLSQAGTYNVPIKTDMSISYLKFIAAKNFSNFSCTFDLIFGQEVISEGLQKNVSQFFVQKLETANNLKRINGEKDNITTKKQCILVFKLLPNNHANVIGNTIMRCLSVIYMKLPNTKSLWERLPINNQLWFTNEELIKIREKFFESGHKNNQLWKEIIDSDYKKQIFFNILSQDPQICKANPKNLIQCLCHISCIPSVRINTAVVRILKNMDYKLGEDEAMNILQMLQISQIGQLQSSKIEKSAQYSKYVYLSAGFILQNTPFDAFLFFIKMRKGYYQSIEGNRLLEKQIIEIWRILYQRLKQQEKIQFYVNAINQNIAKYTYNFQVFLKILVQEEFSNEMSLYTKVLSLFVKKLTQKDIKKIGLFGQKIMLKIISILLQKGVKCPQLLDQNFIQFLDQNKYSLIGVFAIEVLGYLIEEKPELQKKYAQQFMKEIDEPLWDKKQYIKAGHKTINYIQRQHSFIGLKNPHSVCYMNSLFQQLFHIKKFRKGILKSKWKRHVDKRQDVMYQLKKIFVNLQKRQSESYLNNDFFNAFKNQEGEPTQCSIQMDVDEFRNILFDRVQNLIVQQQQVPKEKNFIQEIFNGKIKTIIQGQNCHHKSERQDEFSSLCLDVKNITSLEDSLQKYFKPEILQGDNSYFCEECQKKVKASKRMEITQYPHYMTFVLKRFQFMGTYRQKINTKFQYPMQTLEIAQNQTYRLVGIIIHQGISEAGHYFSYIKHQNIWYQFNDIFVGEVQESQVRETGYSQGKPYNKNAYLLLYEKISSQFQEQQEAQTVYEGMKQEIEQVQRYNFSNRKIEIIFSNEFEDFIKRICSSKSPQAYNLLFEYLAMVKVKKSITDINELNQMFLLLQQLSDGPIINSNITALWAYKIYLNENFHSSLKTSFSQIIVRKYQGLNQHIQNLLKGCMATLHENKKYNNPYYQLLYMLAKKDKQIFKFISNNLILGRILYLVMPEVIAPATFQELKSLTSQIPLHSWMGDRQQQQIQHLKYHKWKLVNLILQQGQQLHKIQKQILYEPNVRKIRAIYREATSKANINQISKLFSHLCQIKSTFYKNYIVNIQELILIEKGDSLRKYLVSLNKLLKIEDNFQQNRAQDIKSIYSKAMKISNQSKYYVTFDILWQWLLKTASKNTCFKNILYIYSHEFSFIKNQGVRNCLFNFRPEAFLRNQDKFKSRYHNLQFPLNQQQNYQLYKDKIAMSHKIFQQQAHQNIFGHDNWDSDADLTQQKIQQGNKIMKYNHKLGQFKEVRVQRVCGDMIQIGAKYQRFDKGDDQLTLYFEQQGPSNTTEVINNSENKQKTSK